MTQHDLTRRTVLTTACGACAVVATGCATYTGQTAPGPQPAENAENALPAGTRLASTSEVPVGGGTVLAEADTVLSQPTPGTYVAFSATCTHQGCPVSQIDGPVVICMCHGSRFSLADGSVVHGPARRPLAPKKITVSGDQILSA